MYVVGVVVIDQKKSEVIFLNRNSLLSELNLYSTRLDRKRLKVRRDQFSERSIKQKRDIGIIIEKVKEN